MHALETIPTRPVGRPTVMTEGARKSYIASIEAGNTRMASAGYVGVSYPSVQRALQADPDFAQAVFEAECRAEAKMVEVITSAATETWTAAAWWLERRRPQQYGRQERLMVLRALGTEVAGLGDEELRALAYGAADGGQDALGEGEVIDVEATVQEAQE